MKQSIFFPGGDLCALGNNCQHVCMNNGNSYVCQCRTGYVLNADQATCSRENLELSFSVHHYELLLGFI
jgi:hypothetical protein